MDNENQAMSNENQEMVTNTVLYYRCVNIDCDCYGLPQGTGKRKFCIECGEPLVLDGTV